MLSEQWFVKMDKLAEMAMEAVRDGRVRFFPERYAKTYLDWLGEKRDWCISRQLWWGHRIPIWIDRFATMDGQPGSLKWVPPRGRDSWNWAGMHLKGFSSLRLTDEQKAATHIHVWPSERENAAFVLVCVRPGYPEVVRSLEAEGFVQDPDVLDTWFSSALWPHSTLGWPDDYGKGLRDSGNKGLREDAPAAAPAIQNPKSKIQNAPDAGPSIPQSLNPSIPSDLAYFYPTDVLCTAREIITLWVARMVMTGLYNVGRVPFQHVYIHPVVQDGWGRRMSKSLGNGVDPLDLIDQFGADAMRFTLTQLAGETQDIRMPVKAVKLADGRTVNTSERFETGRNFCNKLWQAATGFVMPNIGIEGTGIEGLRDGCASAAQTSASGSLNPLIPQSLNPSTLAIEDRWILSRLAACVADVDRRLARYQFNEIANTLYAFFWNDFCDWYVELVKPRLYAEGTKGSRDQGIGGSGEQGPARATAVSAVMEQPGAVPTFPPSHLPTIGSGDVARQILAFVLDQTLRLLHPIVPFITEALWRKLNAAAPRRGVTAIYDAEPALITAAWPSVATGRRAGRAEVAADPRVGRSDVAAGLRAGRPGGAAEPSASEALVSPAWRDLAVEREMDALQNVIRVLRDTLARINTGRSAAKEPAIGKLPRAIIKPDAAIVAELRAQHAVLERLGRCEALEIGSDVAKPPESATRVLPDVEVYVPLSGLIDLAAERKRLTKECDELRAHIDRLAGKLANEGFTAKAPAAVVEQERTRLAEMRERLATIERNLTDLA